MKDITITGRQLRRETIYITACFIVSFLINVYAVVHYRRPVIELFSQLGFVVAITVALYIATATLRVLWTIMRYPIRHINK